MGNFEITKKVKKKPNIEVFYWLVTYESLKKKTKSILYFFLFIALTMFLSYFIFVIYIYIYMITTKHYLY